MATDDLNHYNSPSSSDDDDDAALGVWRVSERSSLFANDGDIESADTRSTGDDTEFSQGSTVMSSAASPSIPQPDPEAPLMDDAFFFNVLYSPQLQADGVQVWTRDYVRAAMYHRERRVSQAARQTAYSLNLDVQAASSSSELFSPKADSPSRLQNLDSICAPKATPVEATRAAAAPPLPSRSPTSTAGHGVPPDERGDGRGRGRSLLRVVQGVLVMLLVSAAIIVAWTALRTARDNEQRCYAEARKGWSSWLPGHAAAARRECEAKHIKGWGWIASKLLFDLRGQGTSPTIS